MRAKETKKSILMAENKNLKKENEDQKKEIEDLKKKTYK